MKYVSPSEVAAFCRSDSPHSRRYRRFTAFVYAGVLGALLLVTWLVDSYWLAAPFIVGYMLATFFMYQSVRGMTDAATSALDERQVSVRNAVYRNAYWAGVMIAFLGGMLVVTNVDRDTAFELGLFVSIWGVITGLPTILLAWTLPSDVADEEE